MDFKYINKYNIKLLEPSILIERYQQIQNKLNPDMRHKIYTILLRIISRVSQIEFHDINEYNYILIYNLLHFLLIDKNNTISKSGIKCLSSNNTIDHVKDIYQMIIFMLIKMDKLLEILEEQDEQCQNIPNEHIQPPINAYNYMQITENTSLFMRTFLKFIWYYLSLHSNVEYNVIYLQTIKKALTYIENKEENYIILKKLLEYKYLTNELKEIIRKFIESNNISTIQ